MHDDVTDIRDFYNQGVDTENSRLSRHQLERDITWRYLETYLPPRARILEVGAATGGYTVDLARRGCAITAVDLAPDLLAECRRRVEEAGVGSKVTFVEADARDLSAVPDADFDAVLLMGPLYHLVEESDRLLALRQSYLHLKPGGVIFSSLISRFGIMGDLLRNVPQLIEEREYVRFLMDHGRRPPSYPKGGFRGYFATVEEIAPLHEEAGFQTLVVAGAEPAISADDESYNRLEGEHREPWLDLLFELSREASMVASSRHLLYIGKRPD